MDDIVLLINNDYFFRYAANFVDGARLSDLRDWIRIFSIGR